MQSIRLTVERQELVRALKTLGVVRRQRFRSSLPVWLRFIPEAEELRIVEERGTVTASVPASGDWPVTGATVDLYRLRHAAEHCPEKIVDLHAAIDAVMVFGNTWSMRLNLLAFGPESNTRKAVLAEAQPKKGAQLPADALPLFRWAARQLPPAPGN